MFVKINLRLVSQYHKSHSRKKTQAYYQIIKENPYRYFVKIQ